MDLQSSLIALHYLEKQRRWNDNLFFTFGKVFFFFFLKNYLEKLLFEKLKNVFRILFSLFWFSFSSNFLKNNFSHKLCFFKNLFLRPRIKFGKLSIFYLPIMSYQKSFLYSIRFFPITSYQILDIVKIIQYLMIFS